MANSLGGEGREVTFITPGGQLNIRLSRNDVTSICQAAADLKAKYFVAADGFDVVRDVPVWGVFELRMCSKDTPVRGTWSLAVPARTFAAETADGAVMYALTLLGKS